MMDSVMKTFFFHRIFVWPLSVATMCMLPIAAFGQSGDSGSSQLDSAQQINLANTLVRDGKIDEAIAEYQQIQPDIRQRSELDYNLAVAQFRKGDIEAAQSLFQTAASSDDSAIASASRFNLGNCLSSKALTTAEQDKPAAIEQLRQAISHYRGSLRGNPDNADARANIELAAELIRKLEEEQKQDEQQKQDQQNQQQDQYDQQEQEQDEQQKQDQNNQQQDQGDQQEQEQKQDQSGEGQDEQSADEQPQDEQQNGEKQDEQQQSSQDSESGENESQEDAGQESENKQQQSQDSKSDGKQPQDAQSESQDQQSSDSEGQPSEQQSKQQPQENGIGRPQNQRPSPDQQQPSDDQAASEAEVDEQGEKDQPVPTGQLTAAGEKDENGKPAGSVTMADPNVKDGMMTKEAALKMLQAVRDRDMLRRLQQERLERSRHVPVDRDW